MFLFQFSLDDLFNRSENLTETTLNYIVRHFYMLKKEESEINNK